MDRAARLKLVLWMFVGLAFAVAVARFFYGLGAVTHLSDATPWGLWIGFDVMSGVALAAGGFVLTFCVYVFNLEKFHPIVRPAVLTAFLGYVAVVVGLLFDLGLPWNIWHMIIYWNPHSPLFEVGWCVMLYLTVLTLEFFPVPAEDFSFLAGARRLLVKMRMPLVIAGIALSTLHQSSLGSLFLIMPYRLNPLWYSPILPIMFFVSAVALGLMMAICESYFTAYIYRRKPEQELMAPLGKAAGWVLLLYLALRLGDLAVRGQLGHLVQAGGWQFGLFWLELTLMVFLPIYLFWSPRVQKSGAWQWTAAAIGVCGVVLDRVDVGGLADLSRGAALYFPSWEEVAVSLGVVAGATLVFMFFVEHFGVWEERPADPEADPRKLPEMGPVDATWLGVPQAAARTKYSLSFALAAAIGFALIGNPRAASHGFVPTPTHRARGGQQYLFLDAAMTGYAVTFYHQREIDRNGGAKSCVICHHMNLPHDEQSPCYACHRDLYLPSNAFPHAWHASAQGAGLACVQCHARGKPRSAATARPCTDCHKHLIPKGATIKIKTYEAPSYADAMHICCLGCHIKVAQKEHKPEVARCSECHNWRVSYVMGTTYPPSSCPLCHSEQLKYKAGEALLYHRQPPAGAWVVLPPPKVSNLVLPPIKVSAAR
jgi:Ni/Fe-hydrogenase subunit HybB-like protein